METKWYEWVFSGVGTEIFLKLLGIFVLGFGGYKGYMFFKKQTNVQQINGNNSVINSNGNAIANSHIETINITNGMSKDEAVAVCKETVRQELEKKGLLANSNWADRMNKLECYVIPKVEELDKNYEVFSDPSFQMFLRKVQVAAACTEHETESEDAYKRLAELFAHRIKNKKNVKKKVSISKAVEIINQIDDDALCAITVYLAISRFIPNTGNILDGFKLLSDLYDQLDLDGLPKDDLWVEHLSILGAVKVKEMSRLLQYNDVMFQSLTGYSCCGIKKESADYEKAVNMLDNHNLKELLVDHELIDGYVRLNFVKITDEYIDGLELSLEQKQCIKEVVKLYTKDANVIKQVKQNFGTQLNKFASIQKVSQWWNSLKGGIILTSVGTVIAHVNAKTINKGLPDLDY